MDIKKYIKRVSKYIKNGVPESHVTAEVVYLATNDLLKDRAAFITGATSGIGYSIAKAYLKSGATVVITGSDSDEINTSCDKLKMFSKDGRNGVFGVVMDNTDVSSFSNIFDTVLQMIGCKIDILVNNTEMFGGDISSTTESEYDTILDNNMKGMFFLSQLVGRYMKSNGIHGNILNIASSSSLRPATSAYMLTRWGIRGFTLGLAKALAPYDITVNGIASGPTATPMSGDGTGLDITFSRNPLGRFALPDEVANMAVFLVSGMGHSIVGDIVYMTGGSGLIAFDDINYSF